MGVANEEMTPLGAAKRIAQMIKGDLNIEIEPGVVRLFIKANWRELSALAHTIHGTKPQAAAPISQEKGRG